MSPTPRLNRYGTHRAPTQRCLEVAAMIVIEGSQKRAAHRLGVSVQTVKNHVTELIGRTESESGFLGALVALGWLWVPGLPDQMFFTATPDWPKPETGK